MKKKKIVVLSKSKDMKKIAATMNCCKAGAPMPVGPVEE